MFPYHFRTALDFAKHFQQIDAMDLLQSSMWVVMFLWRESLFFYDQPPYPKKNFALKLYLSNGLYRWFCSCKNVYVLLIGFWWLVPVALKSFERSEHFGWVYSSTVWEHRGDHWRAGAAQTVSPQFWWWVGGPRPYHGSAALHLFNHEWWWAWMSRF